MRLIGSRLILFIALLLSLVLAFVVARWVADPLQGSAAAAVVRETSPTVDRSNVLDSITGFLIHDV